MQPKPNSPLDQNINDEANTGTFVPQSLKRPCELSQGPRKKRKATKTNTNAEVTLIEDYLDNIVDVVTTATSNQWITWEEQHKATMEVLQTELWTLLLKADALQASVDQAR